MSFFKTGISLAAFLCLALVVTGSYGSAQDVEYLRDKSTGKVKFIRKIGAHIPRLAASGKGVVVAQRTVNSTSMDPIAPEIQAAGILDRYGSAFGIKDVSSEVLPHRVQLDDLGMSHVRFHQTAKGVPVFGNQLLVHLDSSDQLSAINGSFDEGIDIDTVPAVTKERAISLALEMFPDRSGAAEVAAARLYVFNPGAVDSRKESKFHLTWEIQLALSARLLDYSYFIDAHTEEVLFVLNQVRGQSCDPQVDYCPTPCDPTTEDCCDEFHEDPYIAPYRVVYDCTTVSIVGGLCNVNWETASYPGYVFGKSERLPGFRGPHPIKTTYPNETDYTYQVLGYIHKEYFWNYPICRTGGNRFGGTGDWDSWTRPLNTNAFVYVEERSPSSCIVPNAYYVRNQLAFCEGMATAEVIGHEYGHSLTYYLDWDGTSNPPVSMTYWSESGTLQENYSDIVGEGVDFVLNGDTSWVHGNDSPPGAAWRSFSDPSTSIPPSPDRHYSPLFDCVNPGGQGIYTNVGVPSKGAYLMAEGGTFNGCTMQGIGRKKMEAIFFRAVDFYYTQDADFNDAYASLVQACEDLYGAGSSDCVEATKALQAVEMDQPGACSGVAAQIPACADQCPADPNKTQPGVCGCGVADTDSDSDGTPDCNDECPADSTKTAAGACGCGVVETDSDSDGTPCCNDICPNDPAKIAAGACGCGVADTDSDSDGTADCNDGCPADSTKTAAGACGCGVSDTDSDSDGTADCNDGCPSDPAKIVAGVCGCGIPDTDSDFDGTPNCNDLCPADASKTSPGVCGCGTPDTDSDSDGTPNCNDSCPTDPAKTTPGQCGCGTPDTDTDGDGISDCNDHSVQIDGTSGNDTITVTLGAATHTVRINTVTKSYGAAEAAEININALAGTDTVKIYGYSTGEKAVAGSGSITFAGTGYAVNVAGVERAYLNAGSQTGSTAELAGSANPNRLYSYPTYSLLADSPGTIYYRVEGFGALAVTTPGPTDRNYGFLYGTTGTDNLVGSPSGVALDRATGTDIVVSGINRVYAYDTGGMDTAELTSSAVNPARLYSYADYCILTDSKSSFYLYSRGFEDLTTTAEGGGYQYAYLYDSTGNDTLTGTPAGVVMENGATGGTVTALGFTRVYAYSNRGGTDTATLTGSDEGNRLRAYPGYATYNDLTNSFYYYLNGFNAVKVAASTGPVRDYAYLYDSSADDLFYGKGNMGYLEDKARTAYHSEVTDFDYVYAYSTDKNTDDDAVIEGSVNYYFRKSGTW